MMQMCDAFLKLGTFVGSLPRLCGLPKSNIAGVEVAIKAAFLCGKAQDTVIGISNALRIVKGVAVLPNPFFAGAIL